MLILFFDKTKKIVKFASHQSQNRCYCFYIKITSEITKIISMEIYISNPD